MKILIITPELPWPAETGGKASQFATLKALAIDHEFRIVVTQSSPVLHTLACELEDALPHVKVMRYPLNGDSPSQLRTIKSWLHWGKTLLRIFSRARQGKDRGGQQHEMGPDRPYYPFVPLSIKSLQLIESQLGWAELIQAEFHESLYISFLPIGHLPKIFVCHQSQGRFCQRFYESQTETRLKGSPHSTGRWEHSLLAATDAAAAYALETRCMSLFSRIITFTAEEQQALQEQDHSLSISVSPFPIPADVQIVPPDKVRSWNLRLFFVGSSLWHPNVQALQWFCNGVSPLIKEQRSAEQCILHVVGSWSKTTRRCFRNEDVHFHGFSEQISNLLPGNISINPIFTGAGLRTKLLVAAACASPIVTTSIGCEGMGLRHGHDCLVADTAEDFAEAILTLQRNQPLATLLATRALEHGIQTFGPEAVRQRRNAIYQDVCRQFVAR